MIEESAVEVEYTSWGLLSWKVDQVVSVEGGPSGLAAYQ